MPQPCSVLPSADPKEGRAFPQAADGTPYSTLGKVGVTVPQPQVGEHVYACMSGSRPRRLRPGTERPVVLNASWVAAVNRRFHGVDGISISVLTVNLRTGRGATCKVGGGSAPNRRPSVIRIALKRDGAVAWTAERLPRAPQLDEVAACNAAGEVSVLDEGEGIDLTSLSLRGSQLRWAHSGETRSADLR